MSIAYDLIGDIHGQAEALKALLAKLGYVLQLGTYVHPQGRKVIFVGDLVDRGPQVREVLQIVRTMVEQQKALICMGNHEYNILAYHTWVDGFFLRAHSGKNATQISATLKSFRGYEDEWLDYLNWFWQIPLFLELAEFRVVHACWDQSQIDYLRQCLPQDRLTPQFLYRSAQNRSQEYKALETVLKGWEVPLPEGQVFYDKDGATRYETRVRWWQPSGQKWRDISIGIPRPHPLLEQEFKTVLPGRAYSAEQKPVFFGHYWLRGKPRLQAANVCCLDYSAGKEGDLIAYRWDSELELNVDKMVSVAVNTGLH